MATIVQCSVQCGAVQCTVWFSADAVLSSAVYNVVQCSIQCGAVHCWLVGWYIFSAVHCCAA